FHAEEFSFALFGKAECSPLLVDMIDHHMGHLYRIVRESPLTEALFLEAFEQQIVELCALNRWEGYSENGVDARSHKVLPDADGFFTHILGGSTRYRQVGKLVAKSAHPDHLGAGNKDTAVVDAGPQAQDRRNPDGFTYFLKTLACKHRRIRLHEAGLGESDLGASGLDHQNVVLD